MTMGMIYGVGVGPGDPGLLTVRATEVLAAADVVVAPSARGDGVSLALDIARPYLRADCEIVTSELPMTEARGTLRAAWACTARSLAREALVGRVVVFVTLGDPMLYSTWSYIAAALREEAPQVPVETLPGITSVSACAASAGIPLAQGREPLLIWPEAPNDYMGHWLEAIPNVVFMKAAAHLDRLADLASGSESDALAMRRIGQAAADHTSDLRSWAGSHDYFTTVLVKRRAAKKGGEE